MDRSLTNHWIPTAVLGLVCLVLFHPVWAHQVSSVSLISNLDTKEGTYLLDAAMAVIPSEDQALNDEITPEDAARLFAEEYLVVMFDQMEQKPTVEIQRINTSDEDTPEELQQQEVVVKLSGEIPEGAKEYLLYLDPSCPMAVVMVVIKDEKPERRMQVVLAGEFSRPVNVQPMVEGDPFEESENHVAEEPAAEGDSIETSVGGSSALVAGWMSVMGGSLLFLVLPVGAILLTTKGWPVIFQIAAILIGQSTIVSLASWGLVPEVAFAGQILGGLVAVVAFETLVHQKLRWWRLVVLLAAGAMAGCLLAQAPEFRQLFSDQDNVGLGKMILFVTGTELAVVAVAVVTALLLVILNRFDWYEKSVIQPVAVLVGAYGIYEAVAKLF